MMKILFLAVALVSCTVSAETTQADIDFWANQLIDGTHTTKPNLRRLSGREANPERFEQLARHLQEFAVVYKIFNITPNNYRQQFAILSDLDHGIFGSFYDEFGVFKEEQFRSEKPYFWELLEAHHIAIVNLQFNTGRDVWIMLGFESEDSSSAELSMYEILD